MSEQPQSIQPTDQPLDPHTLRAVLAKLNRAADITQARAIVALILKDANPRARVVVLPEPDQVGGQNGSEAVWKLRGKGGYYVMANRILGALSQAGDGNPERARARALAILAAAEFAGGAL